MNPDTAHEAEGGRRQAAAGGPHASFLTPHASEEALPTLPHPDSRARRSARAVRRFAGSLLVATIVLIADQLTKGLAETLLPRFPDGSISIAGDFLRLTYVANRGAAFGILQERTFFFVLVGVAVIAVILASYRYFPVNGALLNLALGLQLGGAVGNLIDRVRYGYVVDFVDVSVWPVFNLADSAIVVGVGILAFRLMQKDRAKAGP